eukprot:gene260-134_t
MEVLLDKSDGEGGILPVIRPTTEHLAKIICNNNNYNNGIRVSNVSLQQSSRTTHTHTHTEQKMEPEFIAPHSEENTTTKNQAKNNKQNNKE